MADAELSIEIRQIEPGDRLTGLSLGADFTPLKIFLQRHAKSYHEGNLARTYGVFDLGKNSKIAGYVTLVCGEICTESEGQTVLHDPNVTYAYRHYPAMKIARLAVDQRYREQRLGFALVDLALGVAKGVVSPAAGCRFVVVDSKQSAVPFYAKAGFTLLDTAANREREQPLMFVDLQKV